MGKLLFIGLAGFIGTLTRYWMSGVVARRYGETFPAGTLVVVRPIGMLEMVDQDMKDEKILAVGTNNPVFANVNDYAQLYPHLLLEIEHFFSMYKELEAKTTKILGWQNAERARAMVVECQERFAEQT